MGRNRRRHASNRELDSEYPTEGRVVQIADKQDVESPLWWVNRLYNQLQERLRWINIYDDYYRGEFPLPWLAPQAEEEFRRIMSMSRANYCGLVIDAMVERMHVEGFRIDSGASEGRERALTPSMPSAQVTGSIGAAAQGKTMNSMARGALGAPTSVANSPAKASASLSKPSGSSGGVNNAPNGDRNASAGPSGPGSVGTTKSGGFMGTTIGEADRETWRIWQANNMDGLFDQAMLEAAINGVSYLMVAPNDEDSKTPHIWVEHPSQCIIEHKPGTQRHEVAAGLKVWEDDWTGMIHATLYLPGKIFKYQARKPRSGSDITPAKWEPRTVADEQWPAETSLDFVPIFELANNPRLLSGGRSELADVLDCQDRITKTIADRLMTQDYGAFPQRWATAWPEADADGNPNRKIDIGQDRLITTDIAETKFGQFSAADMKGYMEAKQEDVHDIAARTRTPAQYLLGEFNNVNGETLKASESGLIAKVRQRMRALDDVLEEAIRRLREMAGIDTDDDITMEVVWRNPEFKTEGEQVDALTKMSTLGVPQQALWERWGASPPEIQRWSEMQAQQQQMQAEQDAMMLLADSYRKNQTEGGPTAGSGSKGSGGQSAPRTPAQNGSGSSARSR